MTKQTPAPEVLPADSIATPRLRLATTMWLAGMLGVVVVALLVVPILASGRTLPLPVWAVSAISVAQGAIFLALAVWTGVVLAPRVGLRAPAFEAFSTGSPVMPALRPQWIPGVIGGLAGGALLIALSRHTPQALTAAAPAVSWPLSARLLYGGVTEELLLRWGFMTLLLWFLWRIFQRTSRRPSASLACLAIVGSAMLFGIGHLPAASALVGELAFPVVAFVVGGNVAFGVIAGLLYWRVGLESAVLAHGIAHLVVVAFIAAGH